MKRLKENRSSLLIAVAAAIGYGGWAVYANYEHGTHAWTMAGIVQASYAFFSTFAITHVARIAYVKYNCGVSGVSGVLAGFGMSFLVMLAIPLTVHNIVGTPDIWQTILPGLIWGSIYLMGFLISLNRAQKKDIRLD